MQMYLKLSFVFHDRDFILFEQAVKLCLYLKQNIGIADDFNLQY